MVKLEGLRVLSNKKGDLMDGDFYVRYLKFSELQKVYEKVTASDADPIGMQNAIIQLCLVRKDGTPVFKPQQINLIEDRLPAMFYADVISKAEELNQFSRNIGGIAEDYEKNSARDQN